MSVKGAVTVLSGVRKAAILTLMVGETTAAAMFKHLSEDEIEAIAREVAVVGQISPETGAATLEEFHTMWRASEYVTRGGVEYAQKLLIKTLGPDMARRVLDRVVKSFESTVGVLEPREGRPAAALEVRPQRAPADDRAASSRTSSRRRRRSSPTRCPTSCASRCITRMATLDEISPDVIDPRLVGHRAAAEVARRPRRSESHGRRPRRRRAVQPPRSRRQHRGARRPSRTSRRTWPCRSAT